jgi:hypothetical protein
MLGTEELFQTVAGKILCHIMEFAAPIVSLAWIPLGIFVGHYGPHGLEYCTGNEIFRSDQLKAVMLAEPLLLNDICYFWISFRQIGHMEKRSLQSGNTFFPVIERG